MKLDLLPCCPDFERAEGTMSPFSGVPVHIILHAVSLLGAVGYNVLL